MTANQQKTSDALRTYRYLRIGMLGAVVLLGASVWKEGGDPCWETSISAYWYTPAQPVFVGVLLAIGFAMIVIKGRTVYEDTALNFAGMFAPVVALVPTGPPKKADQCNVTVPPGIDDMVENNVWALLAAGLFCLAVGFGIAVVLRRSIRAPFEVDTGSWVTLAVSSVVVGGAIVLNNIWDYGELTRYAHGNAARLMFGCMFLAAVFAAIEARNRAKEGARPNQERVSQGRYQNAYIVTALGMAGGLLFLGVDLFGAHEVLALETWEILWFGAFWAVQTAERWNEPPHGSPETVTVSPDAHRLLKA
ncbi:MAG: hypothetical protein ACOYXM_09785 [Actinomycetota bacterium]